MFWQSLEEEHNIITRKEKFEFLVIINEERQHCLIDQCLKIYEDTIEGFVYFKQWFSNTFVHFLVSESKTIVEFFISFNNLKWGILNTALILIIITNSKK